MAVPQVITGDDQIRAARRVFARHRRRLYPDTARCTFCGGPWLTRADGRLVEGCAARQYVAPALAAAGQLGEHGQLVLPASVVQLLARDR